MSTKDVATPVTKAGNLAVSDPIDSGSTQAGPTVTEREVARAARPRTPRDGGGDGGGYLAAHLPALPGMGSAGELLMVTPAAVIKAVPDVVRIAGTLLWRTNQWTVNASLHIGNVVVRGAISGASASVLMNEISSEARQSLRSLLGVAEELDPMPKELRDRIITNGSAADSAAITLPNRMRALLDASSDLTYEGRDSGHPAYVRLLSELSPDEARILRLFAEKGAQPAVDVRTKRPFGVGSQLVAAGITMIGRYAGCQHVDRVPAYLNNMFRLGLVWFSREALTEQSLYDVLEAQEDVEEAMHRAGKGTTVRRSIELTAFGKNLCAMTGLLPAADGIARVSRDETTRQLPPPDAR